MNMTQGQATEPVATPAVPSKPSRLALAVETARMRECYRVAPQAVLAQQGAAFLVAILLSSDAPAELLWGWFGLTLAISALRLALAVRFARRLRYDEQTLPNENLYACAGLLAGLAWAAMLLLVTPGTQSAQLIIAVIVVAIAYTSVVTIGVSLKTYFAAVAPPVLAEGAAFLQNTRLGAEIPWPVLLLLPIAILAALVMYRRSVMPGIQQQQQLQLLTDELQAMFDNTLVGIAHIRNQVFVRVNAECARIYGFPAERMADMPISAIFPANASGAALIERIEDELRETGASVYETEYVRPDGQERHLLAQGHRFDRADRSKGTFWVLMDITARKQAELAVLASEEAYRRLVETVPSMIFSLDAQGFFSFANDAGVRLIIGLPASEVVGRPFSAFLPAQGQESDQGVFRRILAGETMVGLETRIARRDGRAMTVAITAQPLRDPGGRIVGLSGTAVDVTERKRRESELQRTRDLLSSAIEAMSDGFILFDREDRIAMCNRRYTELYGSGQRVEELIGKHFNELLLFAHQRSEQIPPEFLGDTEAWKRERLRRHREANGQPYVYETGDDRWVQIIKRRTADGSVVGIYTDITQMKRSEEAVRILAQHDALTGLPNRRLMNDRLAQAIAQARRNQELVGLLLIDLDDFKPINDEHGHRAGDEVLRIVALRLKECVREVDTVARYGGDEFVVVLSAVNRPRDAALVAEKIIGALAESIPALWMSQHGSRAPEVKIGCSIGISMFPQDATQPDALIRRADAAMYVAKGRGRGCLVFHAEPPASAQPKDPRD